MKHRFSQRVGASEVPSVMQLNAMSEPLRNSIWNLIVTLVEEPSNIWPQFAHHAARLFFKVPVDDLPFHPYQKREWIRKRFDEMEWFEVYDLTEFVADEYSKLRGHTDLRLIRNRIQGAFNQVFEEELSGYRYIGGELAPISNPSEVGAIESAVDMAARYGLSGARAHIISALQLFGKRPEPDYRNAVKEAISAVESIAKQLSGNDSQGLAGALDELARKSSIHGALHTAFLNLYGYTSDEDGIRHAILDEPNVGFDEAKYMVVSCSAFVNYLAAKAQAAGLLPAGSQ